MHSDKLTECQRILRQGGALSPEQGAFLYTIPRWDRENDLLLRPKGYSLYRGQPFVPLFPQQERVARLPGLDIASSRPDHVELVLSGLEIGDLYGVGIQSVDGIPTWVSLQSGQAKSRENLRIQVPIPANAQRAKITFRAWWLRGEMFDLTLSRIRRGSRR